MSDTQTKLNQALEALQFARDVIACLSDKAHSKADREYCDEVLKKGNCIDAVLEQARTSCPSPASFDLNSLKDLVAAGFGLSYRASAYLLSQLEKVTAEVEAKVKNHRKHAARLICEKIFVKEERDMLLGALKDCHDRLNLLCESGRGKMLDSKAKGKAAEALAKVGAQ